MDTTCRSCLIAFLALLFAFAGYGQNQRASSFTATVGITSVVARVTGQTTHEGGVSNRSASVTRQDAPLAINGGFALSPTLQVGLAISQATNAYKYYVTNADLTFTFTGTPLDGARGQVDIKNEAATNILVGWPSSWSVAQGALVTSFIAISNSITEVFWYNEGGSNRVRVAAREIVENFLNPTAGQLVSFHDPFTKTNINASAGGATELDDIADPSADGVVAQAGFRMAYTSTLNGGVVDTHTNSVADITTDNFMVEWAYRDNADANAFFWKATHNAGASIAASLSSAAFTVNVPAALAGGGTSTTPAAGNNTTTIATTAYVQTELTNLLAYLWVPAGALIPAVVNGASTNTFAPAGADGTSLDVFAYDDTTPETNFFLWVPPDNWDLGTFKLKFHWTATAGTASQGVTWGVRIGSIRNDDAYGAILGTQQTVTDSYIASGDHHVSPATSTVTAGGTVALGAPLLIQTTRVPGDAGDTKTGDALLLGVMIQYTKISVKSAAW